MQRSIRYAIASAMIALALSSAHAGSLPTEIGACTETLIKEVTTRLGTPDSVPENCPPGDDRGKIYKATNLRTNESWEAPDSQHSCGGA